MHTRSWNALGRVLALTAAVGVAATSLFAQNSPSTASKPAAAPGAPASRMDFFAGYSYLSPHGTLTVPFGSTIGVPDPVSYSSINEGAIGSAAYFFDRYVGLQAEYADHPSGNNDGASTAQGGLILRYPTGANGAVCAWRGGGRPAGRPGA